MNAKVTGEPEDVDPPMPEPPDPAATADVSSQSRKAAVDMGLPVRQAFRNERRRRLRLKVQTMASVMRIVTRAVLRVVFGGADDSA
jgi:hypothetical protein